MNKKKLIRIENITVAINIAVIAVMLWYGNTLISNKNKDKVITDNISSVKSYVIVSEETNFDNFNVDNFINNTYSTIANYNKAISAQVIETSAKQVLESMSEREKIQKINQVQEVEKIEEVIKTELITEFGYTVSEEEVVLLAKLINCEARGENYDGQVAVGATVLNRLNNDNFEGDTITDIIKAPGQYGGGMVIEDFSYNEENYQAAIDAIIGNDPTNGSVFYYNPAKSSDTWISQHVLSCVIGSHYFYYEDLK